MIREKSEKTNTIWVAEICFYSASVFVVLQGKGMLLVLQDRMLTLVDPDDRSLLHSQPISSIRVWGVGRDHDR